jgi:hypothetical protein
MWNSPTEEEFLNTTVKLDLKYLLYLSLQYVRCIYNIYLTNEINFELTTIENGFRNRDHKTWEHKERTHCYYSISIEFEVWDIYMENKTSNNLSPQLYKVSFS